MIDVLCRKEK